MSKSLNELWKNPCDLHRKLKEFEASFDDEMLDGRFDKLMPVEDKYGNKPIVLALSEEPLHLLVDRVRAVGGNANVFVREGNHIISISAKDDSNPSVASENWADENDWESGSSPISLFIHALKQHPNGIQIPLHYLHQLPILPLRFYAALVRRHPHRRLETRNLFDMRLHRLAPT